MKHLTDQEIGNLIKEKRIKLGLTQTQLGERLGVGAGAVNKWEQGTVTNIKREVLRNISLELKIHPARLIGLNVNPKEFIISSTDFTEAELTEIFNYCKFILYKRNSNDGVFDWLGRGEFEWKPLTDTEA